MVAKQVWIRVPTTKKHAKKDEILYRYRIPIKFGSSCDASTVSQHSASTSQMATTTMEKPTALSGSGNKPLSRPAHALTYQEVIDEIQADDNGGLSQAEAKERLQVYGSNDLGEGAGVQPAKILLRQVANAMTLVTSTIATFSRGETADPLVTRCSSWLWP